MSPGFTTAQACARSSAIGGGSPSLLASCSGRTTFFDNTNDESKPMATTLIAPSPAARKLFGMMVAHADDDLHLTLAQSISLSVHLLRAGEDHMASGAVTELVSSQWIDPAPDGGWLLH